MPNTSMNNEIEITNDDMNKLKIDLNEKMIENENYQQELHELRNKLKACLATQRDLSHANELMEENLTLDQAASEKRINNLMEKFAAEKKSYEDKITELQTILLCEEKKNEKLKETINDKEKLLLNLRKEDPDKIQENFILKEKVISLINDLEKKQIIEEELLSRQQQLEENNATLLKNYNDIRDVLQVKKVDLESLKDTLETTKDELYVCRSELESLKATPASDSLKGNSLFAEVEDNRRKLISDMTSLKNKYLEMKETYDSKEREISSLKAERAVLLAKLEDETVAAVDQSASLIETYKSRISELEIKLKNEMKKLKNKEKEQPAENNSSYLQFLLTTKKKQVEELTNKLEDISIQKILQEEMKYEIEKQLRQWRYKAMSLEAQLLAVKNQSKCEECLKNELKNSGDAYLSSNTKKADLDQHVNRNAAPKLPGINTFEKPFQMPRNSTEGNEDLKNNSIVADSGKSESIVGSMALQESVYMDETIPVSHRSLSPVKSTQNYEWDKENSSSISNTHEMNLKSALARTEEGSSDLMGQEKTKKKVLRFTTDTVDPQKPKLTRQKQERKAYPVVFISSNQSKQ